MTRLVRQFLAAGAMCAFAGGVWAGHAIQQGRRARAAQDGVSAVNPDEGGGGEGAVDGGAEAAPLPASAMIAGEVVDEQGRPVEGARVAVVQEREPAPALLPAVSARALEPAGELGVLRGPIPYPPLDGPATGMDATVPALAPPAARGHRYATSDAAGRFFLGVVRPGRIQVVALHPAYREGRSEAIQLGAGQSARVLVRLLHALGVAGRVIDETGAEAPGAELWFDGALRGIADTHGRFELSRVPGPVELEVRARGRVPAHKRVDPTQPGLVELVLGLPSERVTGVVVDGRGLPVVGAEVTVTGLPPSTASAPPTATTGKAGDFLLAGGLRGPITVEVRAGTHVRAQVSDVYPGEDLRVTLSPGGTIEGEVAPARGGLAAGARVWVEAEGGLGVEASVDRSGRFRAVGLPGGEATLIAEAPGYARLRSRIEVPAAETAGELVLHDLRLLLDEAGVVEGVVRDRHGVAAPGLSVEAAGRRARTDARGHFRIATVPVGDTLVIAVGPDGHVSETVSVEHDRVRPLDLRLP